MVGHGTFIRVPTANNGQYAARIEANTARVVALRPGWNLVSNPLSVPVAVNNIQVIRTTEFPRTFLGASGQDPNDTASPTIGRNFFNFLPGAIDPASGVAEGGAYVAATVLEPGRGYFVRCLSPEGASILLSPDTGSSFSRGQGGILTRAEVRWRISVSNVAGDYSRAFFGMARDATLGFDAKYDSQLPPAFRGVQLSIFNGLSWYEETRRLSSSETFRVQIDGLRRGEGYRLNLDRLTGGAKKVSIREVATGRVRNYSNSSQLIMFVARGSTQYFDIKVAGVTP
jgi:hypothetical protein